MGGKVPFRIRKQVIRQWLSGEPRDQIAKDNEIGNGTVSAIVKQAKYEMEQEYNGYGNGNDEDYDVDNDNHDNFEFDLIRQLAVRLKRRGLDVNSFASSVRLSAMLEKKGLNEGQIESFIENIDIHCFKQDLKPKEFINTIDNISFLSSTLAIPVHRLPQYITQGHKRLEEIKQEIDLLEKRKMETLEDYDVTMDTLYDYEKNYHVFYKLKETQRKLEEAKRQIHDLILSLYGREFDKCMLEFQWSVPEWKFDFISEKLGRPFDMHQLNHIIQELFFNPNIHIDIIRTLGTDIGLSSQEECEECLHSHPPMPPLPSPPSYCSSSSEDLSENRSNRINEKME
ncbi:MAG TPA: hypothetical protein VI278_13630 [Nitrososphaeraceae archaeon]